MAGTGLDAATVEANLRAVLRRVREVCERSGRDPSAVTVVGVTKGVGAEAARAAIEAGLQDLGENYVQEGAAKRAALGQTSAGVRWHLIGHLQRNKARAALDTFDIIQAVDSVRLAEALEQRSKRQLPVFLEVNASGEASKFGVEPGDVAGMVGAVGRLPKLELRGLMTVAPEAATPEEVRLLFRSVREVAKANGLHELSMGMTNDFEVAIEEGATIVRIGRAIFGERPR